MTIDASATPKFSVIVPTCNRRELLAKCLDCLAAGKQTLDSQQYEVIVSDDGTNFSTKELIENSYPWVSWIKGPQRGPAANRNCGAQIARGQFLVFTDDDCLPSAGWLEAFDSASASGESILEGKTITDSPSKGLLFEAPVNETGGYLWSCNMAIRRSRFEELGGFDPGFPHPHLEDVDLRQRILERGYKFQFVQEAVVLHPQRPAKPIITRMVSYESYFYFSRKHHISVSQSGLGLPLLRYRVKRILESRDLIEAVIYTARTAAELIVLLPLLALWSFKYRSGLTTK